MIDLNQLIQLIAIEECKTISSASVKLHISQPALSRSIAKLESELGVHLFDHLKNKVIMNDTGKLCVKHARKILEDIDLLKEEVVTFDKRLTDIFIAGDSPAPLWDIIPLIKELYHCDTQHVVLPHNKLVSKLKKGEYHMIITNEEISDPSIISVPYLDETLMLSMPKDYPLSTNEYVTYQDLEGITMLLFENIGSWHEHHLKTSPHTRFIKINDRSDFLELVKTSALPSFTTNLSIKREGEIEGRVAIPFDEEDTTKSFYLNILKKDKSKFEDLLTTIENYYNF